ncbi:MAG: hypothetical protein E6Q97_00190 [Desulfurellales bacterium]|nr:MAG: hypothetical protein E6Q97_00190 [Desulfurellales bacterium]
MSLLRIATCNLSSISPYSQGYFFSTPRPTQVKADEHDAKHWREHAHVRQDGPDKDKIFIPAQQFKNAILDAAKYIGQKIPGKGQSTYAKHFKAGVQVMDDLVLPIKISDVEMEIVWCAADGKPGSVSAAKVQRRFPLIRKWSGTVRYLLADPVITQDVFHEHLVIAGSLIGMGRWRPINNGKYGKFVVDNCQITDYKP